MEYAFEDINKNYPAGIKIQVEDTYILKFVDGIVS